MNERHAEGDTALVVRKESRAVERSEIERRRVIVARLRWLEANRTAAEIVEALPHAVRQDARFVALLSRCGFSR